MTVSVISWTQQQPSSCWSQSLDPWSPKPRGAPSPAKMGEEG